MPIVQLVEGAPGGRLGRDLGDENADRIDAEVVGSPQDIVSRAGLAEGGALVPLIRRQQVANALAPVPGEDGVLDIVVVGRTERGTTLQKIVTHGDLWEADGPERCHGGLPALLERATATLVERAANLGKLDTTLELGMPRQKQGGEHLGFLDDDPPAGTHDAQNLPQGPLRLHDVMEHVAAPEPVDAAIRQGDGRAIALAKFEASCLELTADEDAGRFDSRGFRLDADHAPRAAHGLRQPEAVEADTAAHVESA